MDKEFFIVFSALASFILGFIVYKKKKHIINRSFFFFTISVSLWAVALFFYTYPVLLSALDWIKITYFCSALVLPAGFYFITVFSGKSPKFALKPLYIYLILLLPLILILFFTDWWVKEVVSTPWGYHTTTGSAYLFFGILVGFYALWCFAILFQKYKNSKGIEKLQIKYIFIGFALFGIFGFTADIITPIITGVSEYFWTSPIFSLFFIGFTTLAITKYHLFEIRVILTEFLVAMMAIILAGEIFLFKTLQTKFLGFSIFFLFCIFGYLLIKATHQEIRRREETEGLYQELKKLDVTKSEFISMASHQLRTPLSAIKGYISMLLEGSYGGIPEKAREKLKNVFHSNERLIRIVNDLLDISKIELGKMEMEKKPTQIEDLIQSCYEEMKLGAEKKKLEMIFQKPKISFPEIEIDELKIRQVILNLIDNAIRYTHKGEIQIKTKKTNKKLQISVKDTGEGLTKEEQRKIFESFTRGAAGITHWIEGAGLGLYVAKRYVELHKGKIWVESKGKGRGSIFFVELPVK